MLIINKQTLPVKTSHIPLGIAMHMNKMPLGEGKAMFITITDAKKPSQKGSNIKHNDATQYYQPLKTKEC